MLPEDAYMFSDEAAAIWGLTSKTVAELCKTGLIIGAENIFDDEWLIPPETICPCIGKIFEKEHIEIAPKQNYVGTEFYQYRTQNHVFESLDELIKFLDGFDTANCYFRGQNQLWKVISSLHRFSGDTQEDTRKQAKIICNTIIKWLWENKYISDCIKNDVQVAMAIAQHYGCPTDIIDVTTDLNVAAYFSSNSENDNKKIDVQKDKLTNLIIELDKTKDSFGETDTQIYNLQKKLNKEQADLYRMEHGCIWIYTKRDFDFIGRILDVVYKQYYDNDPQNWDKIINNDFSLLIEPEALASIKTLSPIDAYWLIILSIFSLYVIFKNSGAPKT